VLSWLDLVLVRRSYIARCPRNLRDDTGAVQTPVEHMTLLLLRCSEGTMWPLLPVVGVQGGYMQWPGGPAFVYV
jgi:hypothetical protein